MLKDIRHYTLGSGRGIHPPAVSRQTLVMMYAKVLAARMAPMSWHIAFAFTVPKNNDMEGLKAERLVAAMCVWGRSFYRAVLDGPLYEQADGSPW